MISKSIKWSSKGNKEKQRSNIKTLFLQTWLIKFLLKNFIAYPSSTYKQITHAWYVSLFVNRQTTKPGKSTPQRALICNINCLTTKPCNTYSCVNLHAVFKVIHALPANSYKCVWSYLFCSTTWKTLDWFCSLKLLSCSM